MALATPFERSPAIEVAMIQQHIKTPWSQLFSPTVTGTLDIGPICPVLGGTGIVIPTPNGDPDYPLGQYQSIKEAALLTTVFTGLRRAIGQQDWAPCPHAHHDQEQEGSTIDALLSTLHAAPPTFGAYQDPTARMAMAVAKED